MNQRIFLGLLGVTALALVAPPGSVAGQTASPAAQKTGQSATVLRTPWGDPDLQGTWTSDDTWGVPFERPKNFGTRATLTEDELKARQKAVSNSEEFIETGGPNAHS